MEYLDEMFLDYSITAQIWSRSIGNVALMDKKYLLSKHKYIMFTYKISTLSYKDGSYGYHIIWWLWWILAYKIIHIQHGGLTLSSPYGSAKHCQTATLVYLSTIDDRYILQQPDLLKWPQTSTQQVTNFHNSKQTNKMFLEATKPTIPTALNSVKLLFCQSARNLNK